MAENFMTLDVMTLDVMILDNGDTNVFFLVVKTLAGEQEISSDGNAGRAHDPTTK